MSEKSNSGEPPQPQPQLPTAIPKMTSQVRPSATTSEVETAQKRKKTIIQHKGQDYIRYNNYSRDKSAMPGITKPAIKMGSGSTIYYWNSYSRDKSDILEINRPAMINRFGGKLSEMQMYAKIDSHMRNAVFELLRETRNDLVS